MVQANLQRSKLALAELQYWASRGGAALALVQEPYTDRIGVMLQAPNTTVVQHSSGGAGPTKAAIVVYSGLARVTVDP